MSLKQEINQYFPESPELYFIDLVHYRVGLFRYYIRDRRNNQMQHAMVYPVEIFAYSDVASHLNNTIYEDMYYVNKNTLAVRVKDKFNNTLTDYGVLLKLYMNLTDNYNTSDPDFEEYIIWDDNSLYEMIDHSTY